MGCKGLLLVSVRRSSPYNYFDIRLLNLGYFLAGEIFWTWEILNITFTCTSIPIPPINSNVVPGANVSLAPGVICKSSVTIYFPTGKSLFSNIVPPIWNGWPGCLNGRKYCCRRVREGER